MQIIYQDSSLVVINKPAGLAVLSEGWDPSAPYLVKILKAIYPKIWTVHRIDKTTSGLILFALDAETHRALSMQFEAHQVEKKYHALMTGSPKWDEKTAKFPLRVNVGHRHRTVVDDGNGVLSETGFKILKRENDRALVALVEASPVTGRTHQIRVHAYALGHPLMGDILYSAPETQLIARPALHAYQISFIHPATKERVVFTAEYADDFAKALK